VVTLVWSLSARQWLAEVQPMQLGYLGSSYIASLRAIDGLLPGYWARAAPALAADPRVPDLLETLTGLLGRLRAAMAHHYPSRPERLHVDVAALLAD
jgi:hypothetical protein